MSTFQPVDQADHIKRNEKRLNRLERRANPSFRINNLEAEVAQLQTDVDSLEAKTREKIEVTLRIPLPLNVTIRMRSPQSFGNPLNPTIPFWITKSASGLVTFEGTGTGMSAMAAGTTFATLPVGYRPATLKRFPINFGTGRSSVTVNTNGTMTLGAAISGTSDFFSLSNAWFYEAAVESSFSWVTPTLLNSWTVSAGLTPQWALDPYGCVILRGRAAHTGTWVDSQSIFATTGQTYSQSEVLAASSDSGYGFLRAGLAAGGAGTLIMIGGAVAGGAISLDGVMLAPSTLDSNFSLFGYGGFTNPYGEYALSNSWVAYNVTTFRTPSAWIRPDGSVLLRGLISTGAIGNHAVLLGKGLHPWSAKMWETVSNSAWGRLDLFSPASVTISAYPGGLVPAAGSSTWFSLDSKVYQRGS